MSTGMAGAKRTGATPGQGQAMVLPEAAAALVARQSGVVGVGQLRAAGVSRETIRWRSGRHWRMLLPGVLALQTGLPSEEQGLVAALVLAGGHRCCRRDR